MLSNKTKYALKALLALARQYNQGPVLIADLARQEKIPRKFLELILLELKHQGFLHSKRGRRGGYLLRKPPDVITLGQIIRYFDGPLALVPCASQTAYARCDGCVDEMTCGIRIVMKEVRDATARILDGTDLAGVLRLIAGARPAKTARRSRKGARA